MLLRPLAEVDAISASGEGPAVVDTGRTIVFTVGNTGLK
jgi:hypothetical protein